MQNQRLRLLPERKQARLVKSACAPSSPYCDIMLDKTKLAVFVSERYAERLVDGYNLLNELEVAAENKRRRRKNNEHLSFVAMDVSKPIFEAVPEIDDAPLVPRHEPEFEVIEATRVTRIEIPDDNIVRQEFGYTIVKEAI